MDQVQNTYLLRRMPFHWYRLSRVADVKNKSIFYHLLDILTACSKKNTVQYLYSVVDRSLDQQNGLVITGGIP